MGHILEEQKRTKCLMVKVSVIISNTIADSMVKLSTSVVANWAKFLLALGVDSEYTDEFLAFLANQVDAGEICAVASHFEDIAKAYRNADLGTFGFGDFWIWGFLDLGILGFGDFWIWGFWDLGILGFGDFGSWGFLDLGILGFGDFSVWGFLDFFLVLGIFEFLDFWIFLDCWIS